MARFLITGGSGFIGTHLADALLGKGQCIVNLDVNAPIRPAHGEHWRQLDLLDREGVGSLVRDFQPDLIFNLAAIADILKGKEAFGVNTKGLENLLAATAQLQGKPRIVHASTQLVCGPGHRPSGPRDYAPYTDYGESKAESEEVLWNWPGDVGWTIVRPTVVWGPHYRTFATSTWYYLYRRWYPIPSGRAAIKTYSYVGNLVDQLISTAEAPIETVNRKVLYGGDAVMDSAIWLDAFSNELTGKPTPRLPYALLKLMALGGDLSMKLGGPSPINSGRLFRMTEDYPVPLDETFRILGQPRIPLEAGVKATCDWLRGEFPDRFR